jgi:hypothetical protein
MPASCGSSTGRDTVAAFNKACSSAETTYTEQNQLPPRTQPVTVSYLSARSRGCLVLHAMRHWQRFRRWQRFRLGRQQVALTCYFSEPLSLSLTALQCCHSSVQLYASVVCLGARIMAFAVK